MTYRELNNVLSSVDRSLRTSVDHGLTASDTQLDPTAEDFVRSHIDIVIERLRNADSATFDIAGKPSRIDRNQVNRALQKA